MEATQRPPIPSGSGSSKRSTKMFITHTPRKSLNELDERHNKLAAMAFYNYGEGEEAILMQSLDENGDFIEVSE